jgi:hypothetical protein
MVGLAHDRVARLLGYTHLVTLIARNDESPDAPALALMLGRQGAAFEASRLQQVSVALHLLQPWLGTLRESSRGWGVRLWAGARRRGRHWLSPGKPGRKLLAASLVAFILVASLGTWPYLTTDRALRNALANYNERLYGLIRKLDPSLTPLIEERKAASFKGTGIQARD